MQAGPKAGAGGGAGLRCDLVIEGGRVVDGSGAPAARADVGICGDRVVAIGDLRAARAARRLDAAGRVVAPGFIDVHTHDDRAVLSDPGMTPKVSQGVTTVVTGNCGVSLAPLAGREAVPPLNLLGEAEQFFPDMQRYLDHLREAPAAVNVAPLVGHTTLRVGAMERLDRPASAAEIERMGEALEAALRAGCIGLSTGLAYPPAHAAPTAEVVALVARLAPFAGIHTTHMRDERTGVVDSVRETLEIGRRAGVPVVISHHKCSGRDAWGLSAETLTAIATAQATQPVDLDVYPYTASSTVLLPDFVRAAERVLVTWSRGAPEAAGRDLEALRAEWGASVEEAIARLQPAGAIYFQMDDADLERILAFPGTMIGSDGLPHDAAPHPRLWGTFPRVLGRYCRERGLLALEDAVWRMTGKPAEVFGLEGRGRLAAGACADVVVFDPRVVIDRATYEAPVEPAAGIEHVLVNGELVWSGGATAARPGRVLRRSVRAR